jgi:hypothetical protein
MSSINNWFFLCAKLWHSSSFILWRVNDWTYGVLQIIRHTHFIHITLRRDWRTEFVVRSGLIVSRLHGGTFKFLPFRCPDRSRGNVQSLPRGASDLEYISWLSRT